ncbi:MAG: dephospho-CoA kinase, partial [Nakamurella sp.]
SPGLAAVIDRFGPVMLTDDGSLNRAALAAVVFSDPDARRDLEAITHPRIRDRFDELAATAPADAVVVNDIPLLTALPAVAGFQLVVGVGADVDLRIRRLIGRGLAEADARARIAAQIDDDARRPLTDVWMDNNGGVEALRAAVDALWDARLRPFGDQLLRAVPATRGLPVVVPSDPTWPTTAARLLARIGFAAGTAVRGLEHIGPTAAPGIAAVDVLDLQMTVADPAAADAVAPALAHAGFPRVTGPAVDTIHGPARCVLHRNADPGRAVDLHVRVA